MAEKQQKYKVQYLVYRLKEKESSSSGSGSHNELIKSLAKNKQVLLFSDKQCKYFENLNFIETYIYFIQGKELLYFIKVKRSNYDKVALLIQKLEFDDDETTKSVTDYTNPYGENTKLDKLNILETLRKYSKNENKFPQFYCQIEILSQFSKTSKKSLGSEFKFLFEEDDKNVQKVKDFYGHKLRDIISYPESMKKEINSEPENYFLSKKIQKESVQSKRKKSSQSQSSNSSSSSDDSSDSSDSSSSQSDDSRKEARRKKSKSKALKQKKQEKQKNKNKDEKKPKRDRQKEDKGKRQKSKDRKSRQKNSKERGDKRSPKQRKKEKSKGRKDDKRDDKKYIKKQDNKDNKHREKQKRSRSRDKQNKEKDFDKNDKKLSYKQNKDETKQRENKSKSKPSEPYRKQNDKAKESTEIGTVAPSLSKNDEDAKKKLQQSISLQIQKSKKNIQGQQKQDKIVKKQEQKFEQEKSDKILESRTDEKQAKKQDKKQQKNQFQSIFNKKKIPIEQRFSKL